MVLSPLPERTSIILGVVSKEAAAIFKAPDQEDAEREDAERDGAESEDAEGPEDATTTVAAIFKAEKAPKTLTALKTFYFVGF